MLKLYHRNKIWRDRYNWLIIYLRIQMNWFTTWYSNNHTYKIVRKMLYLFVLPVNSSQIYFHIYYDFE